MAAIIGLNRPMSKPPARRRQGFVRYGCQIANDNGGGQLAGISGAKAAVELAAKLCTEKGAKGADAAGFGALPSA